MEAVSIFRKKYHIDLCDVDFTKKVKLSSIFSYFQEIASMHVDNLGIGVTTIEEKHNIAWVLIRIRVDIIQYPRWKDEVIIETWPQLPRKLEFERDFIVRDLEGNIMIRAVSTWIILDIGSRELRKSELIAIEYPSIIEERAIDCRLGKLKAFGEPEIAYKKVIGYSDIDINGHLNNSKYVDFIMDCFSVENHKQYNVKSIQVSYINEALPGDTVMFCRDISALNSNIIYIEGINERDHGMVFKTQVEIEATENR